MSSLHPDVSLFQSPADDSYSAKTSASQLFLIRTVRKSDLAWLSEILANSFHRQDGTWGWLYPLLRTGIYEDLRTRIQSRNKHYTCLVAARRLSSSEAEQTAKAQRSLQLSSSPSSSPNTSPSTSPSASLHPAWATPDCKGDQAIGTVEVSVKTPPPWQSPHTRYVYLSNLAVHTDYRRQGVAQQLLQISERVALDWGFQALYLHVLEDNYAARRLYLRAGYQLVRVETSLVSWLIGRPRQLFLYKHLAKEGSKF
jgi:ribosomal protein S18 acetylase RimI-like enzyme